MRPTPFATTLLASDWAGAPCWVQLIARVTGSTITEEVSCRLWLDTSLEPGRRRRDRTFIFEAFTPTSFNVSIAFLNLPNQWSWPWMDCQQCDKDRHIWWRWDSCQGPLGCMWSCSPRGTPHSPSSPWTARRWLQLKHQGPQCLCSQQIHRKFLDANERMRMVVVTGEIKVRFPRLLSWNPCPLRCEEKQCVTCGASF